MAAGGHFRQRIERALRRPLAATAQEVGFPVTL
jgi:hypothetical protein